MSVNGEHIKLKLFILWDTRVGDSFDLEDSVRMAPPVSKHATDKYLS